MMPEDFQQYNDGNGYAYQPKQKVTPHSISLHFWRCKKPHRRLLCLHRGLRAAWDFFYWAKSVISVMASVIVLSLFDINKTSLSTRTYWYPGCGVCRLRRSE